MIRYPHIIVFRTVQPVADAIAMMAERDCTSPADTCRRLILAGLRQHGLDPAPTRRDHADQVAG